MDFKSKIGFVIDKLQLTKPFTYNYYSTEKYRNKIDLNFKDTYLESLFPEKFKIIISKIKKLAKLVDKCNIYFVKSL